MLLLLSSIRRYYLELVGRRRLKITQSWELDGYRVASAELLKDATIPQQNETPGTSPTAAAAADGQAGSNADSSNGDGSSSRSIDGGVSVSELASDVLACGDELMGKMRGMLATRRMAAGHIRELFDRWVQFGCTVLVFQRGAEYYGAFGGWAQTVGWCVEWSRTWLYLFLGTEGVRELVCVDKLMNGQYRRHAGNKGWGCSTHQQAG
jgi:hypothetical protein